MCINWGATETIASTVLSGLLLWQTIKISKAQNNLQKNLADRDIRVQNYQHKMKCYLQIVDAFDIIMDRDIQDFANLLEGEESVSKHLRRISSGRNLMLKSYVEAKLLFSPKIVEYIHHQHEDYIALYNKSFEFITKEGPVIAELKAKLFAAEINTPEKVLAFYSDPVNNHFFAGILEKMKPVAELSAKLVKSFNSDEFNDMMRKEIKFDEE